MIKAEVVCDSISPAGKRLITIVATFHLEGILAQVNKHRAVTSNTASNRAIPTHKIIEKVMKDPALPLFYGENQKGMEAAEEISSVDQVEAENIILEMRDFCVSRVEKLMELGLHKQTANRYLAPWQWTTSIFTATEWANYFYLRDSVHAQPEHAELARVMLEAINNSTPKLLQYGEWHLPFITQEDQHLTLEQKIKTSVARCGRVSYLNHLGKKTTLEEDLLLHDRLYKEPHATPFEHQATPDPDPMKPSGNFFGWRQYRKMLPHENKTSYYKLKEYK